MGLKHVFRYSRAVPFIFTIHMFRPTKIHFACLYFTKNCIPESWKVPTMMTEFFPSPLTQYVPMPIIAMPAVSQSFYSAFSLCMYAIGMCAYCMHMHSIFLLRSFVSCFIASSSQLQILPHSFLAPDKYSLFSFPCAVLQQLSQQHRRIDRSYGCWREDFVALTMARMPPIPFSSPFFTPSVVSPTSLSVISFLQFCPTRRPFHFPHPSVLHFTCSFFPRKTAEKKELTAVLG